MRRQATALVAIIGLALALAGCKKPAGPSGGGGGGGGGSNAVTVSIPLADYGGGSTQSSFSPTTVSVPVGGSVTWRNNDTVTHTSTSDTAIWNVSIGAGDSSSRTFPAAGTFPYACTVHSGMTGRVIVQ